MHRTSFRTLYLALCGVFFLSVPRPAFSQDQSLTPGSEVRAVWITTVNGLDWPKSKDTSEQKRSLREMIIRLHDAHFNTIFFQARGRGDVMYRSNIEPWSDLLTGTLGSGPGWDPLQFVIDEAHARAMEVHAWFNTFFVRSGRGDAPPSIPRHVTLEHPDWVRTIDGASWLDPGIPAVRSYLLNVGMEIVRNYDIDGIQFDFIRYPGTAYPDDMTYKKFGSGPKDDWRRENITKFVRAFYDTATAAKPWIKIGSAPIGIYTNFGTSKGLQGYSELFQDSRAWLRERVHDYVAPQVYWSLGEQRADPDFRAVAKDWREHSFGRQVVVGIGAYKPEVHGELPLLIDVSRSLGAQGNSFFRYESVSDALGLGGRYAYPVNIPPMAWKPAHPPAAPQEFSVDNAGEGIFRLHWQVPLAASDGGTTHYYNVYRSTRHPVDRQEPSNHLAVLPSEAREFTDTVRQSHAPKYYYAVSSLDRGNNESAQAAEQAVVLPWLAALGRTLDLKFKLYASYVASSTVYIPYEVGINSPVFVKILDQSNKEVLTVVDAIQKPGSYVAAADISSLRKGTYTCMLLAGDSKEKKTFVVN
jgi:uncharacterized lipoprotein YddW (UPF0748 family)